ncbi:antigen 5 like allergen Cul n 1-like [Condylostylus longicornis]|uniref:antigen 5 like allergen Cul n 1-like n=1 Tax=Condylostylus longicornis TaxID=2530218 RepID=UPI00244DA9D6|nr:antigen 5 like allergen Cul n 1-like [Condylostylus longicornis]
MDDIKEKLEIPLSKLEILHNEYRNIIASGNLNNYKSAERMGKMLWCSDLAKLAELNVLTCEFKHDKCRNTKKFPYSGQNLGTWLSNIEMETKGNLSLNYFLPIIDDWFNEYKNANMNFINKYQITKEQIGHFTVMVADKNNCVGCSMIKFKKDNLYRINIACNYAWTNIINYKIYKSGDVASKCQTNTDEQFPALCSINEIYSQNPNED